MTEVGVSDDDRAPRRPQELLRALRGVVEVGARLDVRAETEGLLDAGDGVIDRLRNDAPLHDRTSVHLATLLVEDVLVEHVEEEGGPEDAADDVLLEVERLGSSLAGCGLLGGSRLGVLHGVRIPQVWEGCTDSAAVGRPVVVEVDDRLEPRLGPARDALDQVHGQAPVPLGRVAAPECGAEVLRDEHVHLLGREGGRGSAEDCLHGVTLPQVGADCT
ncbi:hypothetical protein EB118_15035 [bacterium]|nr:hypothetical protein [bacterium]